MNNSLVDINNKILKLGIKKIEYINILNEKNLSKVYNLKKSFNVFVAFYVNKTRLIDNLSLRKK